MSTTARVVFTKSLVARPTIRRRACRYDRLPPIGDLFLRHQKTLHNSSKKSKPTVVVDKKAALLQQHIHSSVNAPQSSVATLAALHIGEVTTTTTSAARTRSVTNIPYPTAHQRKALFVSSAIPMIGFGFMDNFIMIQAGGYIDATLGVKFGLATMTAAAMGQVVSDVSGVVFGDTLERFLVKVKLLKASTLTTAQRQLPFCRNIVMAGAVLGMTAGCALGAISLLFIDTEVHERQKRAMELQSVLDAMLTCNHEDDNDVTIVGRCRECTVYLATADHIPLASLDGEDRTTTNPTERNPRMKLLQDLGKNSLPMQCALSKNILLDNHHSSGGGSSSSSSNNNRREDDSSKNTATAATSILCAPVLSKAGNVVAVLEFQNKREKQHDSSLSKISIVDNTTKNFTKEDERTAYILARHISIFMERLASR